MQGPTPPSPPASGNHLHCRASVSPVCRAAALPTLLTPCFSNMSAQLPGTQPVKDESNKAIYKYCIFASHHSSPRSTWAPGLTLSSRVHLNSKKEGEVSCPRSWGSQAGHCSGRRFCLRGKSSACVVASVWQSCFADGKLRHTEVGQQGEGEHMFLEESLFTSSSREGPDKGAASNKLATAFCTAFNLLRQFCGYSQWDWENPVQGLHCFSCLA